MDDLISRQDAIKTLLDEGLITAAVYIEHLPTAEITLEQVTEYCRPRCLTIVADEFFYAMMPTKEIVRCRDCRHMDVSTGME